MDFKLHLVCPDCHFGDGLVTNDQWTIKLYSSVEIAESPESRTIKMLTKAC